MVPRNRGRADTGRSPQSFDARTRRRHAWSILAAFVTVALIVGVALLARQPGGRSQRIVSRGLVPTAAPTASGRAAAPNVPPGARLLAQGTSYIVVDVEQPGSPGHATTATNVVRIDIAGYFVPGDDIAQTYLDGNAVGVGQESADLGTLSTVVSDRTALREGALVSYGYRSNPQRRVNLPDRLHLQATP
jgi:hypothetical protein